MSKRRLLPLLLLLGGALAAGCATGNGSWDDWASELPRTRGRLTPSDPWGGADAGALSEPPPLTTPPPRENPQAPGPRGTLTTPTGDVYRNTYYDFPRAPGGVTSATLFDAACAPLAKVTTQFHDQVCVQGSGRLSSGETVSFAKRDCACAAVCPRTGQHICFERLDPARFPHGRGAAGSPITPLRTVAVDSSIIPLGTPLYIAEYAGLARPDGSLHSGCFVAEDRGIKVVGRQIDVFTGDPEVTARWNARVPSNQGVHVSLNDSRCAGRP
jgi:3D (Asp-Asp-Asp) domain-containing protein